MSTENIKLEVGRSHQIALRSNAGSTGFVWMVASLNGGVLLEEIEDISPTQPIPGKPGTRVFTVVGAKEGPAQIKFVLARPWAPSEPIEERDCTVTVVAPHAPPIVLYAAAMQQAASSGNLAKMKQLAAEGDKYVGQHGEIQGALAALKAEIAKAGAKA